MPKKLAFSFRGTVKINNQWEFQEPKQEVPTIYKAYIRPICKWISPQNMARNMVLTYLYFRILKISHWKMSKVSCAIPQFDTVWHTPVASPKTAMWSIPCWMHRSSLALLEMTHENSWFIVDLPNLKMVIFHSELWTFTRGYQLNGFVWK